MKTARLLVLCAWGAWAAGCGGGSAAGDGSGGAGGGSGGTGGGQKMDAVDAPVDMQGSPDADGKPGGDKGGDMVDNRPDFAGDSWPDGWDHDPYSVPDDFDRSDCDTSGFAAWKPDGIWTTHFTLGGSGVTMFRFGKDAAPGFEDATPQPEAMDLRGWGGGRAIPHIVWNDKTIFWSRTTDTMTEHRVTSWLVCKRPDADTTDGKLARCVEGKCDIGTFHAVRLLRIPGEADALGVGKLAEFNGEPKWEGGLTVNVRVSKGNAYLARYQDGLRVLDVSKAASGTISGRSHVAPADKNEIWNDVKIIADRFILMASSKNGMVVIDAADPDKPVVAVDKFPDMDRNVHSIFIEGSTAYLADISYGGIEVVDMTDPSKPKQTGEFKIDKGDFVHDLTVDKKIGYLNYWGNGMVVVDLTDPTMPKELGRFEYKDATSHASWKVAAGGRTFIVHGDEDWAAHLRTVDVDPASGSYLKEMGSLKLRDHVSIHNILCVTARCYVAWYQDGLRIVDVADGTKPKQVAYFNTWQGTGGKSFYEGGLGVDVVGGLVYLADSERGLLVFKETP